jgi:hypothetical protein
MARAKPKPSTSGEIWFNDAVTHRVGTWGSAAAAEQALIRELKNGLPWSRLLADGTRVPGDAAFWNELFVTVIRGENRAFIGAPIAPTTSDDVPTVSVVVGIKVVHPTVPASKRKPGPGTEPTYNRAALSAAAGRVLARGRPDTKQVFFDQVRAEVPKGTKLPSKDYPTLNRIVGHLWDDERPPKS